MKENDSKRSIVLTPVTKLAFEQTARSLDTDNIDD